MTHVRITFNLTLMTDDEKIALFQAQEALKQAGVTFDSGFSVDEDGRALALDWEFDWSLEGPVTVILKEDEP